jgi:hypothetical protein
MRVDEISRVLASVLRRTYWRMSAPPGAASEASARQIAQTVQDISATLPRRELAAASAKLDPGWESELAQLRGAGTAMAQAAASAKLEGQLVGQTAVSAARGWDSGYAAEGNGERHPDNRFLEGISPSGQQIYAPADHVARTFVPSPEDERLALLIAQQARTVAPDVFAQKETQGAGDDGGFDLLPLMSRAFGLALLIICAALLLSY